MQNDENGSGSRKNKLIKHKKVNLHHEIYPNIPSSSLNLNQVSQSHHQSNKLNESIPLDVFLIISELLNPPEISKLSLTCKDWYQFVSQDAWNQWLLSNQRLRILTSPAAYKGRGRDRDRDRDSPGENQAENELVTGIGIHLKGKVEREDWKRSTSSALTTKQPTSPKSRQLSLIPTSSFYLAASIHLTDKAWDLKALRATIIPLPSSNGYQQISYKLYSRDSLSLPILNLCPKGLLLVTRDQVRFWSSEDLSKGKSIGQVEPQLFTLKKGKVGKTEKSTAWDDVSCCQILEFDQEQKEVEILMGRVNGNLECWRLPVSLRSTLSSTEKEGEGSGLKPKLLFERKPFKKGGFFRTEEVRKAEEEIQDSDQEVESPLDGSEIQAISWKKDGWIAITTKKGRISLWNVSRMKKSQGSSSSPQVKVKSSAPTRIIPRSTNSHNSHSNPDLSQLSKNARRRAKIRASKLESSNQTSNSETSSILNFKLLSTWNVLDPQQATKVGRVWSLLLGGSDSHRWLSVGITGTKPILIYPIDSITSRPLEPYYLSSNGRQTSVYALSSMTIENSVIPNYLLFAGCYDGGVRVYDTRKILKDLEKLSSTELKVENNENHKSDLEESILTSGVLTSLTLEEISNEKNSQTSRLKEKSMESRTLEPIKILKDKFDDSPIYNLQLGGGGNKFIMAGTARNGLVRFFEWGEVENGFSIFAAHPSTTSSPTYALVTDYDRVFGCTDTKFWELDFRPVGLPGEDKGEREGDRLKSEALVGSRAYYNHGDMVLENTRGRIGED